MIIRARAPLRISFAGGGTDIAPFRDTEGGCVLSTTVSRYAYGTLRPSGDGTIRIRSVDYGLALNYNVDDPLLYDGKLDLVKAAIMRLDGQQSSGFELFLHSDAPPGSGLGASSALVVAIVGLLKEFRNLPLTDHEVARIACHIERQELRIPGGLQDQYAATFGGFNYIEFLGDRVVVNPLRLSDDILNELEHNLLLCYTGSSRVSAGIIDDQVGRYREPKTIEQLRSLKRLTVQMRDVLLRRDFDSFGRLLNEEWTVKKQLSPRISTPRTDDLYAAALRAGAIGGKMTGAGGGGYMLLYAPFDRKHEVARRLTELGAVETDFTFTRRGLETWRVPAQPPVDG